MKFYEVFAVHMAEDGSDMFTHPHKNYICEHLSGPVMSDVSVYRKDLWISNWYR